MSREAAVLMTEQEDPRPPGAPGAVWNAFVRQAAWKSWSLVLLLGALLLSLVANVRLATRPPEFVVVEGTTGQSTVVRRGVATDALLKFLAERTRPPRVAVVRFTRDFVRLAFGVNSSTIDATWPEALSMMTDSMRERVAKETDETKLLEAYRAAQVRSDLEFEDVTLVEETPTLLHVKATVSRKKGPLLGGGPVVTDRLAVDLVESNVPVSAEHPDGLAVAEWEIEALPSERRPTKDPNHAP